MLKKIPLTYRGELHQVKLINFSVDLEEVRQQVPAPLRIRNFQGRALISMVDVQLKRMRPAFFPKGLHFAYRHIGFRLLLDDTAYHEDSEKKGIYFLRSFTSHAAIAWGGSLLTDYRLKKAEFFTDYMKLDFRSGRHILAYELDQSHPPETYHPKWQERVGAIDRAYAVRGKQVYKTQIMREKWPLQEVKVNKFTTNFFQTARIEAAFQVPEVIHYQWLSPQKLATVSAPIYATHLSPYP
ncbi:MAG: DUF2071 domain-containing protein [Bacteroidota bacterium]